MKAPAAMVWLALVLAAALHVGVTAWHGLPAESDIMALLPREDRDPSIQLAKDRVITAMAGRVVILVGHADRDTARARAMDLRQRLMGAGLARPEGDVPSAEAIRRLGATYFPHRAGLLAEADRQKLQDGKGQDLVTRALSQIYGFGGPADSRLLARDPFLLLPAFLAGLPVPGNRLGLDDGMLGTTDRGIHWVMVSLTLAGEPYELAFQKRFTAAVESATASGDPGLKVLRLGAVFFAHAGADQAMAETSLIGGLSLAGTIVLILAVFRSGGPLALSLLAIGTGLLVALSVCLALFGTIHVAAQLFGASLIGMAVDYALLYFGQVFTPRTDPVQRLAQVRPGIVLGVATSVIGYTCLGLSPFPGLKQVAVFSAVGLIGSFLTVLLWFPRLDRVPARVLNHGVARSVALVWRIWTEDRFHRTRWGLLLAVLAAAALGVTRLHTDDDVRHQQGLSPGLVAEQAEIHRLTGFGQATHFLVVEGADQQQVLEREEALGQVLGHQIGWLAVSRFVPSARRQADNARLAAQSLLAPHLEPYRARLGMAPTEPQTPPAEPLAVADIRAAGALAFLDLLVVNESLHVVSLDSGADLSALRAAIAGLPGVRLVDPTGDFSRLLKTYRHRAMALLALSLAVMVPLLAWRYGWRGAAAIVVPSAAAVILTPPLVALAGVDFSFFGAMALVLVLSIATDYGIFCAEDRDRDPVTLFSVFLAMATTLLSFGLLAFSDMAAVRAFGATMLVGVSLAFMLAPAVALKRWHLPGK